MGKYRREKDRNLIAYGIILIGIVIAAVSWFIYIGMNKEQIYLASDKCPVDKAKISGHSIFVIDVTDRLSIAQRDWVNVDIKNKILNLGEYHKVTIFEISSDIEASSKVKFSQCSPRMFIEGRDSGFTTSREFLDKNFELQFKNKILEVTRELTETEGYDSSPIFQVIQSVKTNAVDYYDISSPKIYFYSDLLHHTAGFSMFRAQYSYASFAQSNYGLRMLPNLNGIDIELNIFFLRPELQGSRLITFWREMVRDRGGKISGINFVRG